MEGLGICCVLPFGFLLFYFFFAWRAVVKKTGPKHYRLWMWAFVPAYVLVVVCSIAAISVYQAIPGVVFEGAVGFAPTPDVQILHSCRHMPTDWDDTYLVFYADQSTIDRILKNGFEPISAKDIIEYANAPAWWTPSTGRGVGIYATNTDDPEFHSEYNYSFSHHLLIYDPASKEVYYRYRRP